MGTPEAFYYYDIQKEARPVTLSILKNIFIIYLNIIQTFS